MTDQLTEVRGLAVAVNESLLRSLRQVTGHSSDEICHAAADEIERLRADVARLNSSTIKIKGRDEFGEPQSVHHVGIDLRAAIDEAMEEL